MGTSTWVDSDALTASQQTFCSNLLVKRGLAGREVSNLVTYINEVTFSLEWPENANIGSDERNAMFSLINAGCDGVSKSLSPYRHITRTDRDLERSPEQPTELQTWRRSKGGRYQIHHHTDGRSHKSATPHIRLELAAGRRDNK